MHQTKPTEAQNSSRDFEKPSEAYNNESSKRQQQAMDIKHKSFRDYVKIETNLRRPGHNRFNSF